MFGLALLVVTQVTDPLAVVVDPIRPDQDILHYHLSVSVPDTGREIRGATTVTWRVAGGTGPLVLDFDDAFTVDSVRSGGRRLTRPARVRHGRMVIDRWGAPGDTLVATVFYHGTPADGLFIQDNVHGHRSAFADNWPNRAHHWFPGEDHPSDKATASFAVEVPSGWRAVANGRPAGVDTLVSGRTVWHWRTRVPIPVYTMVFGAGRMTTSPLASVGATSVTVWTFPEDSAFAVEGPFRRAPAMVDFYSRTVGSFPYAKLAHVESSTRFGGMENASAIFYAEGGYARRSMGESVVAHETAHQWFGDAVTEFDWHHLWLSEGFASYFGPLFFESVGETDRFRSMMRSARDRYLASDDVHRPVIDTAENDYLRLLNRNNYQKGAWMLHMLRGLVGDSAFFRGVRAYYERGKHGTALTADLLAAMEATSGRSLRWFFDQWLTRPGYPELRVSSAFDHDTRRVTVRVEQVQPDAWGTFRIRVPVALRFPDGWKRVPVSFTGRDRVASAVVAANGPPLEIQVDPGETLLLRVAR